MRLLRLIASIDPKSGGPAEAALSLDRELKALGHILMTVTLDPADAPFITNYPLAVTALGPTRFNHGYSRRLLQWLGAHASSYDAVIIDGIWQFPTWAARLVLKRRKIPYFVFSHGMLDPWFNRTYRAKYIKKLIYWTLLERRNLAASAALVFTCEEERLLARHSFPGMPPQAIVTSFGTRTPPSDDDGALKERFYEAYPHLRHKRLFLFLSRINRKKGCDLLLEAFSRVAKDHPGLHLVMAGPDNAGWSKELRKTYDALEREGRVTWPGMLTGDMKWGAFHAAEVFCLPSHQENFGIVVAEALGCGTPVLISNKVNIWRETLDSGAAIVNDDSVPGTVASLETWLGLTDQERDAMRTASLACFTEKYNVVSAAADLSTKIERHLAQCA